MEFSKELGLRYNYFPNLKQLVFEDGVCYTLEEAVIVAKLSPEDIRAVHLVKSVFGGNLETRRAVSDDDNWFENAPKCTEEDPTPVVPTRRAVSAVSLDAVPIRMDL